MRNRKASASEQAVQAPYRGSSDHGAHAGTPYVPSLLSAESSRSPPIFLFYHCYENILHRGFYQFESVDRYAATAKRGPDEWFRFSGITNSDVQARTEYCHLDYLLHF